MIQLLVVLSLFSSAIGIPQVKPPGNTVEILHAEAQYRFGEEITLQAELKSAEPVQEVYVFLQPESASPLTEKVTPGRDGSVHYRLDIQQQFIRPFSRIYYWFMVKLSDGTEVTSGSFWFDYEDNRFSWQHLDDGLFQVHWYGTDAAFGQDVLNVSRRGLDSIQKLIPLNPPKSLDIYVYADPADLETTLPPDDRTWVAGLANPDLGAVMVSVTPGSGQRLELERQVPHELAHILLYQSAGPGYNRLPFWLVEGLASLSELYANPEYERAIQAAVKADSLLPMETLCAGLPQDADNKFLAYAQSAGFTRFLHEKFGVSGMQALVQVYSNGLGCDEGLSKTFSASLSDLETEWHVSVGEPSRLPNLQNLALPIQNLLPYLFLLAAVLAIPLFTSVLSRKDTGHKLPPQDEVE